LFFLLLLFISCRLIFDDVVCPKKGLNCYEKEMKEIAKDADDYRNKLVKDIDRDSNAYNDVMAAFKLPKGTEQEQEKRKVAIQEAQKNASLVPLDVANDAFKIIELAEKVVKHGNKNAVTDAAVAVMMARTAVLSALYNVKINLVSINDIDFVEKVGKDVKLMESKIISIEREILSYIAM